MLTSETFSLPSNEARFRFGLRGIANDISSDLFPPGLKLPSLRSGRRAALAHLAEIIALPDQVSALPEGSGSGSGHAGSWRSAVGRRQLCQQHVVLRFLT